MPGLFRHLGLKPGLPTPKPELGISTTVLFKEVWAEHEDAGLPHTLKASPLPDHRGSATRELSALSRPFLTPEHLSFKPLVSQQSPSCTSEHRHTASCLWPLPAAALTSSEEEAELGKEKEIHSSYHSPRPDPRARSRPAPTLVTQDDGGTLDPGRRASL